MVADKKSTIETIENIPKIYFSSFGLVFATDWNHLNNYLSGPSYKVGSWVKIQPVVKEEISVEGIVVDARRTSNDHKSSSSVDPDQMASSEA